MNAPQGYWGIREGVKNFWKLHFVLCNLIKVVKIFNKTNLDWVVDRLWPTEHGSALLSLGEVDEESPDLSHTHANSSPQALGVLVVRGEGDESPADGWALSDVQFAVEVLSVDVVAELLVVLVDEDALLCGILTLGDDDTLFARGAVLFEVLDGAGNVVSTSDNAGLEWRKKFKISLVLWNWIMGWGAGTEVFFFSSCASIESQWLPKLGTH